MMLANVTITIFNKRADPETGGYAWKPTTVTGASWYASDAETVDPKGGLIAASRITIRIPEGADAGGKDYADPLAWKAAADVSGMWTLQGGDIIVKGTAEGDGWTPKRLAEAFAGYCTILAVTDNRRAPRAPHFKVVGA